jgi:predicted dehydrogenase
MNSQNISNKLRVGVVGIGIGQAHIEAYQKLPDQFELIAICDIDKARANQLAAKFQLPRVVTDLADLCKIDELDVVDICTPSYLHFPQIKQSLAAGKHVISEKPPAGSLQEIDELIDLSAEYDRRVMPIFQYRFGNGAQKLKFLIDEGLTGPAYLSTIETAWRRRAEYYAVPWRGRWKTELGGALVTLAIHAHDLLCYFLGPIKSVFAHTATLVNPIETEDTVAASLEMVDGSLATLAVTTGSAHEISRYRYCFKNLTAESNTNSYRCTWDPWHFTGDSPEIDQEIEETLNRFEALPEGYEGQFWRFHQAFHNNTELPVTLADGRVSLELITALYYSAQTGQRVDLPISSDHPMYAGWQRSDH